MREILLMGDPFTCPIYYCMSAKEFENNMDPVLQFSVCTLSKVISWCANVWQGMLSWGYVMPSFYILLFIEVKQIS